MHQLYPGSDLWMWMYVTKRPCYDVKPPSSQNVVSRLATYETTQVTDSNPRAVLPLTIFVCHDGNKKVTNISSTSHSSESGIFQ